MITCVVFDFDGTLVQSNHIKRRAFFDLAGAFEGGAALMEEIMAASAGRDRYWIFDQFASRLPDADATILADRYTRSCREQIARAPEVRGTATSLHYLRNEGKLLFVNSATPVEPLTELISLRRMEHLFDGIYGAPATKYDNLQRISEKHGLEPREILVVGDGEPDRNSAEMLKCHFVAVGGAGCDFAVPPPCCIPDLADLPKAVFDIDRSCPLDG
jgi:phosphoglycolate phosphatase-like HAD superfamily hydrolase